LPVTVCFGVHPDGRPTDVLVGNTAPEGAGAEEAGAEALGGVETTGDAEALGGVETTGDAEALGGVETTGDAEALGGVETTGDAEALGADADVLGAAGVVGAVGTGPDALKFTSTQYWLEFQVDVGKVTVLP
jgi:hypothetical protein